MINNLTIFGLADDADKKSIADQYAKLVIKEYHPTNGSKNFRLLAEAYEELIESGRADPNTQLMDDWNTFETINMTAESCHKILGIPKDADTALIKKTYLRHAMKWHPDKNNHPHAKDRFQALEHAFNLMQNPDDPQFEAIKKEIEEILALDAKTRDNIHQLQQNFYTRATQLEALIAQLQTPQPNPAVSNYTWPHQQGIHQDAYNTTTPPPTPASSCVIS